MIGEASEAKKNSFSPKPTTNGLPLRAATILLGSLLLITTIAYAPTTFVKAIRTASATSTFSLF